MLALLTFRDGALNTRRATSVPRLKKRGRGPRLLDLAISGKCGGAVKWTNTPGSRPRKHESSTWHRTDILTVLQSTCGFRESNHDLLQVSTFCKVRIKQDAQIMNAEDQGALAADYGEIVLPAWMLRLSLPLRVRSQATTRRFGCLFARPVTVKHPLSHPPSSASV
jgi:hypothetical protein